MLAGPSLLTGTRVTSLKQGLKVRVSVTLPHNTQQDTAVRTPAGVTVTSLSHICTPSYRARALQATNHAVCLQLRLMGSTKRSAHKGAFVPLPVPPHLS